MRAELLNDLREYADALDREAHAEACKVLDADGAVPTERGST